MTDRQAYEALIPVLEAMDKNTLRSPDMPVERAIHEGEVMHALYGEDREKFNEVGLDPDIGEMPAQTIGCLRIADANLKVTMLQQSAAVITWKENEPIGYRLRDDVLAASAYAFRKSPEAMRKVRLIRQGSSHSDMIQDLPMLAALGRKNVDLLRAIRFDVGLLDKCEEQADLLGRLWGAAFAADSVTDARIIRDKAFTRMRLAMADIRETAVYVFRSDSDRLSKYYSAYRKTSYRVTEEEPDTEAVQNGEPQNVQTELSAVV